jgi:hypothetical protein
MALKIIDEKLFIDSHVAIIKNYKGKKAQKPYLDRLRKYCEEKNIKIETLFKN